MTRRRRAALWCVIGLAAVSIVGLIDIGRLLADVQIPGRRSYNAAVFTSFKLLFWDTSDLADAIGLWHATQTTVLVQHLLQWHTIVDAIAFTPMYCLLLFLLLRRVGVGESFATKMVIVLATADWTETLATYLFIARNLSASRAQLIGIQLFSDIKWVALIAVVVTAVAAWLRHGEDTSGPNTIRVARAAQLGQRQHPAIALSGLIVLTALFLALVALPAGGPLEQLPDVLRYQLSREAIPSFILSMVALVLFTGAVAAAGLLSTDPAHVTANEKMYGSKPFLVGTFIVSCLLWLACYALGEHWTVIPSAPFLVVLTIAAAALVARRANIHAVAKPVGDDACRTKRDEQTISWVAGLAGVIPLGGGLGLVRAAFPPMVLGTTSPGIPWYVITAIGIVSAVGGGFVVQVMAVWMTSRVSNLEVSGESGDRTIPFTVAGVSVALAAAWLAVSPAHGQCFGTTGVVAIGFGVLALVIGLLKWASRRYPAWSATHALGFGRRTPWLVLVFATWIVASLLNTEGGYHDARVAAEFGPSTPRYSDLESAFRAWVATQTRDCSPRSGDPTPMVLVAAPGGGIRAAYWTAEALDSLFGPKVGTCAGRALFAVSGVSGGSVGVTTWMVATSRRDSSRKALAGMSSDRALAAATAGMLLRDLIQPFTGITTSWRDRAALLEDGWLASSGVFTSAGRPLKWGDVGDGLPWVPVLVLNGSSVTDGCRVLIANVGRLPAVGGRYCGGGEFGPEKIGPVSAAIDPFPGLHGRSDGEAHCTPSHTGMRAVTAALLSARFPLVSPSGALRRCVSTGPGQPSDSTIDVTTYTVDGGYYENSGMLTLLQLWSALAPLVQQHNDSLKANEHPISPWIVVVDNHYRRDAEAAKLRRPLELIAPLKALSSNAVLSQSALEQAAAFAVSAHAVRCASRGRAQEQSKGCLVVIAPREKPSVAAPLGWVLSPTSQADLDGQLKDRLARACPQDDASLSELFRQLTRRAGGTVRSGCLGDGGPGR